MRVHVARNRKLVISSICTVANYEYGFYFNFALDGSVELEVKATGIVNAYCLKPDEPLDHAHEVYVAPQIAAQHHQHVSHKPYMPHDSPYRMIANAAALLIPCRPNDRRSSKSSRTG